MEVLTTLDVTRLAPSLRESDSAEEERVREKGDEERVKEKGEASVCVRAFVSRAEKV